MTQNILVAIIMLARLGMCTLAVAQPVEYNIQDGYVAKGYDMVEYFNHRAVPGNDKYIFNYKGAHFRFSTFQNLAKFRENPENYIPQYGGWCAYGMATNGKRYSINPMSYELRDGKLFLFYNTLIFNAQERWLMNSEKLIEKADAQWKK